MELAELETCCILSCDINHIESMLIVSIEAFVQSCADSETSYVVIIK